MVDAMAFPMVNLPLLSLLRLLLHFLLQCVYFSAEVYDEHADSSHNDPHSTNNNHPRHLLPHNNHPTQYYTLPSPPPSPQSSSAALPLSPWPPLVYAAPHLPRAIYSLEHLKFGGLHRCSRGGFLGLGGCQCSCVLRWWRRRKCFWRLRSVAMCLCHVVLIYPRGCAYHRCRWWRGRWYRHHRRSCYYRHLWWWWWSPHHHCSCYLYCHQV